MMRQMLVGTMFVVGAAWVGVLAQAPGAVTRTPWGDPDLQGVWTSEPELSVPFERAPELGDRQTLTDAEFEQRRLQAQKQLATDNAEFDVETADTAMKSWIAWTLWEIEW